MSRESADIGQLVNEKRLWDTHMALAEIGAIEGNGVNRQALTHEDIVARRSLVDWAQSRGYIVKTDEIANLYFIRPGQNMDLPFIATGSHMDSQPKGGRFDGIYGVLAGLEVFEALDEGNIETDHPLMVVAWTNEEGGRFSPGAMGSMVYSGSRKLSEFLSVADTDGVEMGEALSVTLAATPTVSTWGTRPEIKAYVEAHIEQGPVLEDRNLTVGVVTGIQGVRMFEAEVSGQAAHAGTTPLKSRADAVITATSIIQELQACLEDQTDILRFTVGRMDIQPNSPNVVADFVRFSIDLRHPDQKVLEAKGVDIVSVCENHIGTCQVSIREIMSCKPCEFPESIVSIVENAAGELALSTCRLPSGAFHDALFVADTCPTGMIFVPSVGGISHNPAEYTEPSDLANGARLLAATLVKLSRKETTV